MQPGQHGIARVETKGGHPVGRTPEGPLVARDGCRVDQTLGRGVDSSTGGRSGRETNVGKVPDRVTLAAGKVSTNEGIHRRVGFRSGVALATCVGVAVGKVPRRSFLRSASRARARVTAAWADSGRRP